MRTPRTRRILLPLLALGLAGCAALLDPDGNRCRSQNAVTPDSATLAVGATLVLSAAGFVEGQSPGQCVGNVRGAFRWTSSAPAVASVDPATGAVTARAVGTAAIRAQLGDYAGEARVHVVPMP